jgi:superfamily I DNA and/or RNA helicase
LEEEIQKHFERLQRLIDLEEAEEVEAFREDFLKLSPDEREHTGKALLFLKITESHFSPAGHRLLTFSYRSGRELPVFSLAVGDIVSLSAEGVEIMRYPTGTVYEKDRESITVAFDWLHENWLDETGTYHLNRSGSRATYKRMGEALGTVRDAEHSRLALFRDVTLGLKPPEKGDPVPLSKLPFFNANLNEWQKKAAVMVLESPLVSLIHGPPGTGKTTVLVEVIRQTVAQGKFVFATAPSNTACDNLLECLVNAEVPVVRLGHPARIMEHLRDYTLDFKTAQHPHSKWIDEREREIDVLYRRLDRHKERRTLHEMEKREIRDQIRALKADVQALESEVLQQVLAEARVFVGTHAGAADYLLKKRTVDLLVMDEASQATEPSSWIPLLKAQKAVLAGDHFQLPPTVRSKEAEEGGLAVTLFEKLHKVLGEEYKTLLRVQYRMHEKIMNFSSRQFYQGQLIADDSVRRHVLADLPGLTRDPETEEAFVFLDTAGRGFEEKLEPGSESRYNPEEAELVDAQVKRLLSLGVKPEDIAVISPYSAQVRYLTLKIGQPRIEVDSVDGFQGREKEVVILSLVRSNMEGEMGFLADTRRMNVAMTRAKRKLFVIGDSSTLSAIPFYQNFIQYSESIGAYRSSWEYGG